MALHSFRIEAVEGRISLQIRVRGEAEHGPVEVEQRHELFDLERVVVDQEAKAAQVPVLVERHGIQHDPVGELPLEA